MKKRLISLFFYDFVSTNEVKSYLIVKEERKCLEEMKENVIV